MTRICPNPMPWNEAYKRLTGFTESHSCVPPNPPKPLILNGWVYSNDIGKKNRWDDTVKWADKNGCMELVNNIEDGDFYCVDEMSSYQIGPMGGPMFRPWDYDSKNRPSSEDLQEHLDTLLSRWTQIADKELSQITRPIAFTGNKARRLLVKVDEESKPPWGGWDYLSDCEPERRTFTKFRSAINNMILPHEVDHIDFIPD